MEMLHYRKRGTSKKKNSLERRKLPKISKVSSFGTSETGWEPFKLFPAPKTGHELFDSSRPDYLWENNRYSVSPRIQWNQSYKVPVLSLSFKDYYRTTQRDWRDFQNIKNELAGYESRAFEVYPEDHNLMDVANQFWLWCFPVGHSPDIGLFEARFVGEQNASFGRANQRPFRAWDNAKHPKIGKAWLYQSCEDVESQQWLMKHNHFQSQGGE